MAIYDTTMTEPRRVASAISRAEAQGYAPTLALSALRVAMTLAALAGLSALFGWQIFAILR